MGYDTNFEGMFVLDRPLDNAHRLYLDAFARTRRVRRNADKTMLMSDPKRDAVGLSVGIEGEYFVGANGPYGQELSDDVEDNNEPPRTQPELWCQWIPSEDGAAIVWDGNEKFYCYIEWIKYIVKNFLAPWGYTLNGEVKWHGEERGDIGVIIVENNVVNIINGE